MKTCLHFWQYLAEFTLEWEIFQIGFVDKTKIHILCSVTFFSENRAVYEKMSKNLVEPERLQMTIWRPFGYSISKVTRAQRRPRAYTYTHARMHAHTAACNACCFFTTPVFSWTSLIVRLYVHCLSCWISSLQTNADALRKRTLVCIISEFAKCRSSY
jgi:hypothetical protein